MTKNISYALLGSGRLARHLQFYFQSLNLPLTQWSRNGDPRFNTFTELDADRRLQQTVERATHVLLGVRDDALAELCRLLPADRVKVHFSGTAQIQGVHAAHPLMTFGDTLEAPVWYRRFPFVLDEGTKFHDVLPGLPNAHFLLPKGLRPLYHALCSLAGNSTFLLWKQIGDEFEKTLGLPRALLAPFLHQVVANSSRFSESNFTGPVARRDWSTVASHLAALTSNPELLEAYRGFLANAARAGHPVPKELV